jgi:cytochrome c oxidase subunit 6b
VCQNRNGDEACQKQLKMYRSICPAEWVENWTEQIENGTFPGATFGQDDHADHH